MTKQAAITVMQLSARGLSGFRIKDHLKKCRKNPANRKQDTPESPEMDIPDPDTDNPGTSSQHSQSKRIKID